MVQLNLLYEGRISCPKIEFIYPCSFVTNNLMKQISGSCGPYLGGRTYLSF